MYSTDPRKNAKKGKIDPHYHMWLCAFLTDSLERFCGIIGERIYSIW
jgi:hypothetical protein